MTKKQKGITRIGIPVTMLVVGLIGLGSQRHTIKTNSGEIKTKVSKEVFQEFKEANANEHELMLRYLEAIHGEDLSKK